MLYWAPCGRLRGQARIFAAGRIRRRSVAVDDGGIRFVTLADAGNTAESQRRLYELNRQTALDSPDANGTFPPFDQFEQFVFGASWFRADGQILAADGTR